VKDFPTYTQEGVVTTMEVSGHAALFPGVTGPESGRLCQKKKKEESGFGALPLGMDLKTRGACYTRRFW
jgi:hypothetical protein